MENLSARPEKNTKGRNTRRKAIKLPTPERMANIALHYLERYASSEASLRRVLTNRIQKAALFNPEWAKDAETQAKLRAAIETIIEKHRKTGVLNDAAYAETKLHSLRRSGRSRRAIVQKLTAKGVSKSIIEKSFEGDDEAEGEMEMKAAMTLARRRRLGPYRKGVTPPDQHKKDIASMARAGFSFDVIKQVLGRDIEEEEAF